MGEFSVSLEPLDDGYRVTLAGELDLTTTPTLHEHLSFVAGRVEIDCSGLEFLDSTGINEFVQLAKRVDSVMLVNPNEILRQVLEILGLAEVLPVVEEVSE
jgi:anti-anti-sigma factor